MEVERRVSQVIIKRGTGKRHVKRKSGNEGMEI